MRCAISSICFLVFLAAGFPVQAQGKSDPNEVKVGVIKITSALEYVTFELDGQKIEEDYYYEDDGKILVVENVDRMVEHTLLLTPGDSNLKWEQLTIYPGDFKLTKVSKTVVMWQFARTIKFRPWAPGEKEKAKQPAGDPPPKETPTQPEKPEATVIPGHRDVKAPDTTIPDTSVGSVPPPEAPADPAAPADPDAPAPPETPSEQ